MIRLLIVGFGNPLRSDDGLGWYVAQDLACTVSRPDVRIIAAQQLTPEIAEMVSDVEQVLFLDAARDGSPGTVTCAKIEPDSSPTRFSHHLTPLAILKLAADLYAKRPVAHLLTVAGASFETGEKLSLQVSAAIPELMTQIRRFME